MKGVIPDQGRARASRDTHHQRTSRDTHYQPASDRLVRLGEAEKRLRQAAENHDFGTNEAA